MWCKTSVHRAFKTLPRPTNPEHGAKLLRSQEIDDKNDIGEELEPLIEGDFEDHQPILAPGSAEAQQEVVERKLAGAKSSETTESETRELTLEENRRLDAEMLAKDAEIERQQAAGQQKSTGAKPKVQFGRRQ
jgi:hypothetical protein